MFANRLLLKASILTLVGGFLVGCATAPSTDTTYQLSEARFGHAVVADDEAIYVIGGSNASGALTRIERINPTTKETSVATVKLVSRRYISAVWDGDESIYIYGGYTSDTYQMPVIEVFNTRTRKVTRLKSPLSLARRNTSAAFLDGKIYVVGGSTFSETIATEGTPQLVASAEVAVFDIDKQEWYRVRDLPVAMDTRAFVFQSQLCVVGGYNHSEAFSRMDCYNADRDVWEPQPAAPVPISAHSVTVYGDQLYVFGDYNNLDQVLIFDFTQSVWSIADLPYRSSRHNAATVFGDEIFVIGGTQGTSGPFLADIQVFPMQR
ncbi:hypothetical protein C9927_01485 [Pseudidiomarina aestuarii]|uniref:Galactose oxidase n=1 Tax=Pseudidiomarina aestuarii TaxID=624146 RepID=A0A2T4D7B1_9GAMM|nr:hypothetical protein C9939_00170 [Pseudidiomarina aestuarii]PTB89464.1 hypothetical protein C9928_03540 [Pseudidiomarina aestuarii]PTB89703.1 hypothetical protein C9927_01485 [Pseudidiomarina aestuarii]